MNRTARFRPSRRHFLRAAGAMGLARGLAGPLHAIPQQSPSHLTPAATMHAHPPAPPRIPLLNAFTQAPFVDALPRPELAQPLGPAAADGTQRYRIRMRQIEAQLHRDMQPTRLWSYGDHPAAPLFDIRKGRPIEVEWVNDLPAQHFLPIDHTLPGCDHGQPDVRAVVHLHGGRTPAKDDGFPEDWYVPGQSRIFRYPNGQDAATLWYHDHAMGLNRLNVYAGLFGMYLLRDDAEDALHLPSGEQEIPMTLYDRSFTHDSQLYYPVSWDPAKPWVPEVFGDFILVNGKVRPFCAVEPRQYRLRVVNAANGRFFSLSLTHGHLVQIGSDQGLLAAPVVHTHPLVLAPAERADLLVDFSPFRGQTVRLNNGAFGIVEFRVADSTPLAPKPLPAQLSTIVRPPDSTASVTRPITLHEYDDDYARSMVMLLNRKHWSEPVTEQPKLGTTEVWEFINLTEDTHPMHLHLVRFQILDRRPIDVFAFLINKQTRYTGTVQPPAPQEMGWKDTVQCSPGMITRVLVHFDSYPGRYLYHCHILEHAANDMMRPFDVLA